MTLLINLEKVNRSFKDNHVLKDLNFSIEAGTITGLLGVNGSGKTTMMRCLLGLIKPHSGVCEIFGEESWVASPDVRQKIGFVPQQFDNFLWMTVDQILDYTGAFYEKWQASYVDKLKSSFGLGGEEVIADLSVGMQQRVSIVMALGHSPDLLVLDEPVAALDPVGRRTFIELLLDIHINEGKTIIFSTHITSDIERVAARVAMMQKGQVTIHSDIEDLKESYCRIHLHCQSGVARLVEKVPGCLKQDIQTNSARLVIENIDDNWYQNLRHMNGVQIEMEYLNLDEIFLVLNS